MRLIFILLLVGVLSFRRKDVTKAILRRARETKFQYYRKLVSHFINLQSEFPV